MLKKQYVFKILWLLFFVATVCIFFSAYSFKQKKFFSSLHIAVTNTIGDGSFVQTDKIENTINSSGNITGRTVESINLQEIEKMILQDPWVQDVQLYIDNKQVLQIKIREKHPIARCYVNDTTSFYLSEKGEVLPLPFNKACRILAVTGLADVIKAPTNQDTFLQQSLTPFIQYLQADSFFSAQIAQINLLKDSSLEIYPVVGSHIVQFGTVDNFEQKLHKLKIFYTHYLIPNEINTFKILNVEFNHQVIAKNNVETAWVADSLNKNTDSTTASNALVADSIPEVKKEQIKKVEKKQTVYNKAKNNTLLNNAKEDKRRRIPKAIMKTN